MASAFHRTAVVAAIVLAAAAAPALATERTLWELGKPDRSSEEFSRATAPQAADPVFTIGRSRTMDWLAWQPGSQNAKAGARTHPFTIRFQLGSAPSGYYRLAIWLILTHTRQPDFLRVAMNGHAGKFYLHRTLNYDQGENVRSPIYGVDQIEALVPAAFLARGWNRIELTAVDAVPDPTGDSWLAYDAVRLDETDDKPAVQPQISVWPTVFFRNQGGRLAEQVTAIARFPGEWVGGTMELQVGGASGKQRFANDGEEFGEAKCEFLLPEFTSRQNAQISIVSGTHVFHAAEEVEPPRKWTIFVAPHAHLDIGYTDFQPKVAEIQSRNIDKMRQELALHPELRYSLDGSWILEHYLDTRDAASKKATLDLIRKGKIAVPAQYANLLTGYASLEVLLRSLSYSNRLHHELNLPFDYANITDIPSYTWSYPSILHAMGIRYFAAAANSDRAPIILYGRWNEKSPFWWRGPDGSSVLMSYSRQYFQLSFTCGLPARVADCAQTLPAFLDQYAAPSYVPDAVLMYGNQAENTDLVPGEAEFLEEWDREYAYPKLVFTTFPEYLRYIDEHFGPRLATVTGGGGPYWEDGIGTDAFYAAMDRATEQRAPSAEKLMTIAGLLEGNVRGPVETMRRAWKDLVLYAEHTFTSGRGYTRPEAEQSVRQLEIKDQFAVEGREKVDAVLDTAFAEAVYHFDVLPPGTVVFNPLSWARSGLVETDLEAGRRLIEYPGGQNVPFEIVHSYAGYRRVRFLARDVPSLGWKSYGIVADRPRHRGALGSAAPAPPAANAIENRYYRIAFDAKTGAVSSIFDKDAQRELIDTHSPYKFDQYLYVSGGGEPESQIVFLWRGLPKAELTVSASGPARLVGCRSTPYGQVMTLATQGIHAPQIRQDIALFANEKKIEIANYLHKNPVSDKEAVYFAFPFALDAPRFRYEIQNGSVNPASDILHGGNVDWFTVQHWVKASSPGLEIGFTPVDAPLVMFGDINRGIWPEHFHASNGTIFSYVINNYWHTNFRRVQGGDFVFRYAITSGRHLEESSLARFGREAMTPIELAQVAKNDKYDHPAAELGAGPASFLAVDSDHVVVEAWKQADDGRGTIVRLLETAGKAATAYLTFPSILRPERAWSDDAAENDAAPMAVRNGAIDVPMGVHQIRTIRIVMRLVGTSANR